MNPADNPPNNPINTNPIQNGAALLELIKNVRKDWDTVLELTDHQAKIIYAKFESAKAAGFSEPQALEVCTKFWG